MATAQRPGESRISLTHSEGIVRASVPNGQRDNFDADIAAVTVALSYFRAKDPNTWGCDGVGYAIERDGRGVPFRSKSTVGPRQFLGGLDALRAHGYAVAA